MTPSIQVAITGLGGISAIGRNVAENLESLRQGRHGIAHIQYLDTYHRDKLPAGEIKLSNEDLCDLLEIPKSQAYTRSTLLGIVAVKEAIDSAGIDVNEQPRIGLISATTVGGMDATERFYDDYLTSDQHRHYISTHPCGHSTEQIARYFGLKGFMTTISTACSSSANAMMLGARMIKAGILDKVIVGGTDSLSKFTINGFNSLMIYSDTHCTPFDENRKGLNLGEAAAFLLLESTQEGSITNRPMAYLSGYGNANDAFHQTASSEDGEGSYAAINTALDVAGLKAIDIDYINAHGTATPNNDLSEGKALLRIFGGKAHLPDFSSTKAFTGHTLAAAGAIEAIFCTLAIKHQIVLPNLNFSNPITELGIRPTTRLKPKKINHVLSNSLGFGGNCSSLIFSKANG